MAAPPDGVILPPGGVHASSASARMTNGFELAAKWDLSPDVRATAIVQAQLEAALLGGAGAPPAKRAKLQTDTAGTSGAGGAATTAAGVAALPMGVAAKASRQAALEAARAELGKAFSEVNTLVNLVKFTRGSSAALPSLPGMREAAREAAGGAPGAPPPAPELYLFDRTITTGAPAAEKFKRLEPTARGYRALQLRHAGELLRRAGARLSEELTQYRLPSRLLETVSAAGWTVLGPEATRALATKIVEASVPVAVHARLILPVLPSGGQSADSGAVTESAPAPAPNPLEAAAQAAVAHVAAQVPACPHLFAVPPGTHPAVSAAVASSVGMFSLLPLTWATASPLGAWQGGASTSAVARSGGGGAATTTRSAATWPVSTFWPHASDPAVHTSVASLAAAPASFLPDRLAVTAFAFAPKVEGGGAATSGAVAAAADAEATPASAWVCLPAALRSEAAPPPAPGGEGGPASKVVAAELATRLAAVIAHTARAGTPDGAGAAWQVVAAAAEGEGEEKEGKEVAAASRGLYCVAGTVLARWAWRGATVACLNHPAGVAAFSSRPAGSSSAGQGLQGDALAGALGGAVLSSVAAAARSLLTRIDGGSSDGGVEVDWQLNAGGAAAFTAVARRPGADTEAHVTLTLVS